ncbi:type IX secretion system plug protein domain-containing protein [Rhodohalobacter mucosus]|uniref:Uncharacterized protein n=1 Tax=Rhodohalobacter mucosus TaxID=2079485 RepID=A0A316TRL2_9BACT|nr:type IX secretion system plug protein domain-containing protein [Rhodohalobacter mucosus]PWN07263.1 hypothetical protein DDZ15_05535 [Rhodohalobacter mucosus]
MKLVNILSLPLLLLPLLYGCAYLESAEGTRESRTGGDAASAFSPPGQFTSGSPLLYSDLSPSGQPGAAPVLTISADETLTLFFETEGIESAQYTLRFSHHNPDWSSSSLPPEFYLDGLPEVYLSRGELNRNSPFRYRQYSYTFPNRDIRFRLSGNYMLRISNSQTGNLLFTLPFFVSENEGSLRASVERILKAGTERRIQHRPVARYVSPEFVEMPQFDLSVFYAQNQFWGRMKEALETDFSGTAESGFELRQGDGFNGNFAAASVDIRTLSQLEPDIDNISPAEVPVELLIDEDIDNLYSDSGVDFTNILPGALRTTDSEYTDAEFRFDPGTEIKAGESVYLTGDFNNWQIEEKLKLSDASAPGFQSVTVRIKQGHYRYKYILYDGERFDLNPFESAFANQRQEYHAFVYFRDPETQSYRLLNVLRVRGPG